MTNIGELPIPSQDVLETSEGPVEIVFHRTYAVAYVRSSKLNTFYRVTVTRDFIRCDDRCKGFHFRGKCRHTIAIRNALANRD